MQAASAWAAQVTLAWDPSNPAPEGYRLFQRTVNTAYDYTRPVWSGSTTTGTLNQLSAGTRYYFVVRAFAGASESENSNEVYYDTPAANRAPAANAGADQTVAGLTAVTLNGSASADPDGDTLTYMWTQTSGTVVQLSDPRAVRPTFTAPAGTSTAMALVFRLSVTDPSGLSASDTCQIQVAALVAPPPSPPVNQPPIAEAGPNQSVFSGSTVRLNGSGSSDPEGRPLAFQWVQTAGPGVQLSAANVAQPTFMAPPLTADQSVVLSFQLTVRDSGNLARTDTCLVEVIADGSSEGDGEDDPGQNQPPLQPVLTYPTEGDNDVELRPRLDASAFADPDVGDRHAKTEWLITAREDGRIVLNVTRRFFGKTSLRVPRFTLDANTDYAGQVRYFDDQGNASQWSPAVSFTTREIEFFWADNSAAEGRGAPAQTDLNANGVPDANEPETKSIQAPDGRHAMLISIAASENIVSLDAAAATQPLAEDMPPDGVVFPYGLLSYRIQVREPGQEAAVTLHFSDRIDPQTTWMDYDDNGNWSDSSTQMVALPDGFTFERLITDGGQGDADGVANGTIIDLVAPLDVTAQQDAPGDGIKDSAPAEAASSGGGGGCFIRSLMK